MPDSNQSWCCSRAALSGGSATRPRYAAERGRQKWRDACRRRHGPLRSATSPRGVRVDGAERHTGAGCRIRPRDHLPEEVSAWLGKCDARELGKYATAELHGAAGESPVGVVPAPVL